MVKNFAWLAIRMVLDRTSQAAEKLGSLEPGRLVREFLCSPNTVKALVTTSLR